LFAEAQQYIPAGVNSPVRAFKNVGGTPIFIQKASGAYLYDQDGNKFIDYINSWGPMILGHAFESVVEAIIEKTKLGTSFGTPTEIETEIAKLTIEMVPNIEKIRFVNSGTEACMSAIRLARGFTKREKIIKFAGCYHGHSDAFLVAAGSGASTFGVPDSAGVTQGATKDTLLADYNSIESVLKLYKDNPNQIAAIIIEPVAGNMGCVTPKNGFLESLREICNDQNSLLIFDEVMTGFRLAKGGAQERLGIKADIVCFGKVIGGGLPVGAFAGSSQIMDHLSPLGNVYQAGTLSGNPLAMAAGLEMLKTLNNNEDIYKRLDEKTTYLKNGITDVLNKNKMDFTINNLGSMISVFLDSRKVYDFKTAHYGNTQTFKDFFHGLLNNGIYIAPSSYETWFISDALTYNDLDYTIEQIDKVSSKLQKKP